MKRLVGSMSGAQRITLLVVTVFVLLASVAATVYFAVSAARERENERIRELAEPLEVERRRLEHEIADIERQISALAQSGATLTTVVLDVNEGVYENVFQIFEAINERIARRIAAAQGSLPEAEEGAEEPEPADGEDAAEHRVVGTVCLSSAELPGLEGKMSEEQLREMLEAGWSTAIYVNAVNAAALDAYLTSMESEYDRLGIARTDTACFALGQYNTSLDAVLKSHGITCVIDTVAEGENILSRDLESEIWRVKADGWSGRNGSAVAAYNDLLNSHGCSAFLISTVEGHHRYDSADLRLGIDDASFERMLDLFSDDIINGSMHVDSAASARPRYATYLEDLEYYRAYYEAPIRDARARLAEVKARLHELYYGS